jgi:class 3 adenylate cyclase
MKCPECRIELPHGANFCFQCGRELGAKKPHPASMFMLDTERKRVTALFSDLSGYTAMTEKMDPEEVKEITSCIFGGIRETVARYEGFIERYSGDGVLALFGVPRAHEDDPVRAILAAQEIHQYVEGLSPCYQHRVGGALSMHSGINTGLAVTADISPKDGTPGITGEAINVASRLSSLALARQILVGPETYRISRSHFTFQPVKLARVKGISEPIPVYRLVSERATAADIGRKIQVSSGMVGRDRELARLEHHIRKVVDGRGSVVNVFGEAGIGKSRLLAELRQRELIGKVSFQEGRSISTGRNLSFHPIIDLFKQWSGIMEEDTGAEAAAKLENVIGCVCGSEADEVFPFVATLIGMKLTGRHYRRIDGIEGEALEKLILKAIRELLIRSTERIPLVIVMEDLHWADTSSLEILESLFRMARDFRVVFINVFRPGYLQGGGRRIETLPQWLPEVDFDEIAVRPLDQQASEALVNNILNVKELGHTLRRHIEERAGGNPFFIEEIVHSLIDQGAIVRNDGGFASTGKIDGVVIPNTINDVLVARIDRLDEKTRDLVKIASVIGRNFFHRILKEVAGTVDDLDGRLSYLKEIQLI